MMARMNISIASYSFHGLVESKEMDVFGYLESCKYRYHVNSADIWNGFIPTLEKPFLEKVKAGLQERELVLANLCVDGPHLWEDDPAVRAKHQAEAKQWLEAGIYLGAKTVRIDAGGKGDVFTNEQFDWIVKGYKDLAKIAQDAGIKVGPENHWGPEVKPEVMKKLSEAVNHPGYGVLLHFGRGGDEQFSKWAMHTHLSWDVVLNQLDASLDLLGKSYTGFWSAEHHSGKNEYSEVGIQLARLRDGLSRR